MICKNCKRFFMSGNRADGLPNGLGFVQKDGKKLDICANCLISLGQMDEKQKAEFFEKLKGSN